ncbi:MAG: hypothetical protein AB8B72_03610 [Crocinitomicaceae bacterium]
MALIVVSLACNKKFEQGPTQQQLLGSWELIDEFNPWNSADQDFDHETIEFKRNGRFIEKQLHKKAVVGQFSVEKDLTIGETERLIVKRGKNYYKIDLIRFVIWVQGFFKNSAYHSKRSISVSFGRRSYL